MKKLIALAVLLGAALAAPAQVINSFTLTHNGASYTENNLMDGPFGDQGGTGAFKTANGATAPMQNWWWFRATGENREFQLSRQVFGQTAGNHARVVYVEQPFPSSPTVQIDLEYTLTSLSPSIAMVQIGWKIHNLSPIAHQFNFFGYSDFDLGGTAGNDTGVFTGPNAFMLSDPSGSLLSLSASSSGLTGWQQGPFATVRNLLVDGAAQNLTNNVPNFVGDVTNAFQWQFPLGPNGAPGGQDQFVGSYVKIINNPVPEPASMIALGMGVAAIAARRRRK